MSLNKKNSKEYYLDAESLRLLKMRDARFLKELFLQINSVLLNVCASQKFYGEHAHDLVFNTWEKFFANLDQFEGRSQIKTFLCGILFNQIREYRRSQKKYNLGEDAVESALAEFDGEGWWINEPSDPEKLVANVQVGKYIKDCLDGISEQQRLAFLLRENEDLEPEEICEALKVSFENLRVLIFRAKQKLRDCIETKINPGSL